MKARWTLALVLSALVPSALVLLAPSSLYAQELRGRLVAEGGLGEPLDGAIVTLLAATGDTAGHEAGQAADVTIDAAFTSQTGTFSVHAGMAGEYRIRVDRIGFKRWTSEPFTLYPMLERIVEFEIPILPVRLADLDVSVHRECVDDPRRAAEVELVWDEARKALEAALLAQKLQLFRYSSVVFNRSVTTRRGQITHVTTFAAEGVSEAPFRSLPAERLSEAGYIQTEGDTIFYYAPDATVLLSPAFQNDHCFGLDRDKNDGRPLVGLTFKPHKGRHLPDISGALWLDEETSRLDHVEVRYENIPYRGVDDRRIAGRVEYGRLPTGAFIVRDWYIRMPDLLKEEGRERYHIGAFTEYGAELRGVERPDGDPIQWRVGAGVHGTILNSVTGEPLRDATLTLDRPRGDDEIRHTGPHGEFFFDGLTPGNYRLAFTHPMLDAIDWRPPTAEFELAEDERHEVSFALPTPESVLQNLCGSDVEGTTAIVGYVRDLETRFPISPARLWAEWTRQRTGSAPGENHGREAMHSDEARTDGAGRYVLCGVPTGLDVALQVAASQGRNSARAVRTSRLVNLADFRLRAR